MIWRYFRGGNDKSRYTGRQAMPRSLIPMTPYKKRQRLPNTRIKLESKKYVKMYDHLTPYTTKIYYDENTATTTASFLGMFCILQVFLWAGIVTLWWMDEQDVFISNTRKEIKNERGLRPLTWPESSSGRKGKGEEGIAKGPEFSLPWSTRGAKRVQDHFTMECGPVRWVQSSS